MKGFLAALALVLGIGLSSGAQATNLVLNGDFSTGDFSGWSLFGNTGYTSVIGGEAHLGPIGSDGFLVQDIATTAGQQYSFSFDLANVSSGTDDFKAVVDLFGTPTTLLSLANSAAFTLTTYTYLFTATGADTVIGFSFRNDPSYWTLDNVSVTLASVATTPIPPALLMLLTGLGGMGVMARRRRRLISAS